MKKIALAICLAFLSVGAFASSSTIANSSTTTQVANNISLKSSKQLNYYVVGEYTITTSCGTVWTVTAPSDAPASAHYAAWQAAEDACGTDIEYIEIYY